MDMDAPETKGPEIMEPKAKANVPWRKIAKPATARRNMETMLRCINNKGPRYLKATQIALQGYAQAGLIKDDEWSAKIKAALNQYAATHKKPVSPYGTRVKRIGAPQPEP